MVHNFETVSLPGSRSGKCATCGKRTKRSTTFSQTINPFNKTAGGFQKTRDEIYAELRIKRDEWLATTLKCSGCE